MSIVVQHLKNNKVYMFLGASYSYYRDTTPSFLGGMLFPNEDEEEFRVAAVCDENGMIFWAYTNDLKVLEIDGQQPLCILSKYNNSNKIFINSDEQEKCPACGNIIDSKDKECSSCGLNLLTEDDDNGGSS